MIDRAEFRAEMERQGRGLNAGAGRDPARNPSAVIPLAGVEFRPFDADRSAAMAGYPRRRPRGYVSPYPWAAA